MNKQVLFEYINKLKKDDITMYAYKQGIILTNDELNIIYNNIKNNPERILNNPLNEINKIKNELNINTYNKLLELYNKYKIFIEKKIT